MLEYRFCEAKRDRFTYLLSKTQKDLNLESSFFGDALEEIVRLLVDLVKGMSIHDLLLGYAA
jgi:hypothetical protein